MAKKYVYSTLTDDMVYAVWKHTNKEGTQRIEKSIVIFGGANRVNKKTFITPKGMLTIIEESDAKLLEENKVFLKHKEKGFVTIESKKADSVETVVKNQTKKDKAAQKTSEDFKEDVKKKDEKHLKEVE